MSTPVFDTTLRDRYLTETARIRTAFAAHGDGLAATLQRAAVVDEVCQRLWRAFLSGERAVPDCCMVAMGGYGRATLFPHSDVDLLFLFADQTAEEHEQQQEQSAKVSELGTCRPGQTRHSNEF
jgi:[protein-PII] uridylyltransferase